MDPLSIHGYKINASNKYNKQQFVNNVVLYTSTTLFCTLFCASPLWYPPLYATFNVVLFFSLPKITSLFFSPKVLFVLGNLIVIFLVGESKVFTSKTTTSSSSPCDVYYNKHLARRRSSQKLSSLEKTLEKKVEVLCSSIEKKLEKKMVEELSPVEKASSASCIEDERMKGYWVEKIRKVEKVKEVKLDDLPAEEVNKLADDFIARVNRRRRLEAELFSRG